MKKNPCADQQQLSSYRTMTLCASKIHTIFLNDAPYSEPEHTHLKWARIGRSHAYTYHVSVSLSLCMFAARTCVSLQYFNMSLALFGISLNLSIL